MIFNPDIFSSIIESSFPILFCPLSDDFFKDLPITPIRGDILDRNGRVLATNEFSYRLTITPEKVTNLNDTLIELESNEYIDTKDIERFKKN